MAFVFRADKKDIPENTAQQPGPGHYDYPQKAEGVENRIPFHSSKERELIKPQSNDYPGPGSYNVAKDILSSEADQHVFFIPANPGQEQIDYKATSVFKSQAKRFGTQKIEENPGPGTYNMGKGFVKKGTTLKHDGLKNNLKLVHDIIQKGNKIAPSIPSNVHSYGYTENEEHRLLLNKNPLMQVQQFVGPGYYESKTNNQGTKYHGPTFHKNNVKKGAKFENSSATSNLIGPGTYSLEDVNGPSYKSNPHSGFVSNTTRTFDYNVKKKLGLGKFPTRTPLSSQSVGRSNISGAETEDDDEYDDEYMKDATPGPGYYHNDSLLSSFVSKTPGSRLSLSTADKLRHFPRTMKAQAFGSSPRFKDPNPNGHDVGPGEYDVTSKPKNIGLKYIKVPFQSSNTRFNRANMSSNPGPGNYDPPVNLIDQVKKKGAAGYAGSFGVTENRFKISKLLEETPGPGTYISKNKDTDPKLNPEKQSHFFVSDSKRGVFVGKLDHQAHPGSYELDYYNIAKKKDKDEDDGLDQPKRYPFNTGQTRFDKPKEKPIPEHDDEDDEDDDEPRFGITRNLESLLKSKMKQKPSAVFLSNTKRNIGGIKNDGLPGPGTYYEQAQNAWNKRTFNIHFTGE